jgi:hypothetical protein
MAKPSEELKARILARISAVRSYAAKRESWEHSDMVATPRLTSDSPFLVKISTYRCWFRHLIDPNGVLFRHFAIVWLPDAPGALLRLDRDGLHKVATITGSRHVSRSDVEHLCVSFGFQRPFERPSVNTTPAEDWQVCENLLTEPYLDYGRLPLTEVIQAVGPASAVRTFGSTLPSA